MNGISLHEYSDSARTRVKTVLRRNKAQNYEDFYEENFESIAAIVEEESEDKVVYHIQMYRELCFVHEMYKERETDSLLERNG